MEPLDTASAVEALAYLKLPRHIAERIVSWTGGYPEPSCLLAEAWHDGGRSMNLRDLERDLWPLAKASMRRLLEWIGAENDVGLCRFVAEVGHGVGRDSWALSMLHRHPWQKALLDSGRLRANCLGPQLLIFSPTMRQNARETSVLHAPSTAAANTGLSCASSITFNLRHLCGY